MTAKETAKLMAWGLGPNWQAANASAPIANVVNGIRRGMYAAPTVSQTKVTTCGLVQHALFSVAFHGQQGILPWCICFMRFVKDVI